MEADRQLLRETQERLDEWTYTTRDQMYRRLFAGDNAAVTAEEWRFLDEVNTELAGDDDDGLWGMDEYAVVMDHPKNHPISVVCTRHPEIPLS